MTTRVSPNLSTDKGEEEENEGWGWFHWEPSESTTSPIKWKEDPAVFTRHERVDRMNLEWGDNYVSVEDCYRFRKEPFVKLLEWVTQQTSLEFLTHLVSKPTISIETMGERLGEVLFRRWEVQSKHTNEQEIRAGVIREMLTKGDFQLARKCAEKWTQGTHDPLVFSYFEVLRPSDVEVVSTDEDEKEAIRKNEEWLSNETNLSRYDGKWVALEAGRLRAHAEDFQELMNQIDDPTDYLVTLVAAPR